MPAPPRQPPKSSLDADDDGDLEHIPTERRIQLAVTAVRTKVLSERGAELYYRVPRSTIQNRIKGMVSRQEAHAARRSLSKPQEEVLVEWTKGLAKRGIPLSLTTIGSYAAEIYGAPLGVTWPVRFKKRHPDLKIKWTTKLEACRAQALNRTVVHDYFTLLSETIETYDIQSKNIWNMDEKGIQLGIGDRIRVLVDRDQKVVQKIESGNRDLVTIIECISADGTALHPSVVFQGQRRDLRWGENNPCDASISISPNGWTDQELGALWLEKDFAPASAERLDDPGDYRLLILDGHNSHCTFRFIDFAKKHRIIILCLPSHTTHALQPCDVGVFGPLAAKWKARVSEQHARNIVIDKYNLLANYTIARDQAFKKTTIISAFRKCGIWPLDETAIPDLAFEPARNYTTQASMPVVPSLPSILVSVSTSESTTSTPSTAPPNTTSTMSASELDSTPASTHSAGAANTSSASQPRPSTPTASTPTDVMRAAYTIAMPSPLRKTASRKALAAENDELRNLLKAAGIELEKNVAQMALMQRENANVRQQLYAKKNKQKRSYTTGQARLMTGAEMHATLLKELQKKQMGELHSELKKKIFPVIRKEISEAEKVAKAAKKQQERAAKAAQKETERAAKAAARARGRGRGRGRGQRGRGHGRGAIAGRVRTRDSDCEDELGEPADEETDLAEHNASPYVTSSDEESDADEPFMAADDGPSSNDALWAVQGESDGDSESGEEETGIDSFNGHRWESRRNLQFQVVWTDGDVTWEPLSSVNDCAAMEIYLAHRDVDDPLRLSKRKFLINTAVKASNE